MTEMTADMTKYDYGQFVIIHGLGWVGLGGWGAWVGARFLLLYSVSV